MAAVSRDEAAAEHLLMNLRLSEGLDLSAYQARWNTRPDAAKIAWLQSQGMVTLNGDVLSATPAGRLVLNRVIEALV
jgi:oxygen-independent coproporphyrinogen-3 oxidase